MPRARLVILFMTMAAGVSPLQRPGNAQQRPYFGVLGGVSTLSADSRTSLDSNSVTTSSYKPENGPTVDVYVGLHWGNYFSVQGDYLWNRNRLILDSLVSSTLGAGTRLYERPFHIR